MHKATFLEGTLKLAIQPDGPLLIKAGESGGADPTLPAMEFVRSRGQIYITNVIKYRTPENRLPRVGEQRACGGHLRRELDLIRPKVVGALGAIAARALLGDAVRLKDVRGRRIEVMNTIVYPMYHPAFALRNLDRDPQILEIFEADLRRACRDAGLP